MVSYFRVVVVIMLALANLVGACGVQNQRVRHGQATLVVVPRLAESPGMSIQGVVPRHTRQDLRHVLIKLFDTSNGSEEPVLDSGGQAIELDIPTERLDQTLNISGLAVNRTYRLRGFGYRSDGTSESDLISRSDRSFVDVTVGPEDAVITKELKVSLSPVPFSAEGTKAITLTEGRLNSPGSPKILVGGMETWVSTGSAIVWTIPNEVRPRIALGWQVLNYPNAAVYPINAAHPPVYDQELGVVVEFYGVVYDSSANAKAIRYLANTQNGPMMFSLDIPQEFRSTSWEEMTNLETYPTLSPEELDAYNQILESTINNLESQRSAQWLFECDFERFEWDRFLSYLGTYLAFSVPACLVFGSLVPPVAEKAFLLCLSLSLVAVVATGVYDSANCQLNVMLQN